MFALISTEELEGLNQIMVKQLKNRYNDPTIFKRFIVGIDRAKMRLYDCEQKAQEDVLDSGTKEDYNEEKAPKKSFAEFKFSWFYLVIFIHTGQSMMDWVKNIVIVVTKNMQSKHLSYIRMKDSPMNKSMNLNLYHHILLT